MIDHGLDLAVIGNGRTAALVDPSARIVWWCFPRFDGDPVFCRLLAEDEEKGFADVVLDGCVEIVSEYGRNTPIVTAVMRDAQGAAVRVTDFAPRFYQFGRTFRPPQIIRIVEPVAGLPRVTIRIRPTHHYGQPTQLAMGSNHIRYSGGPTALRVTTDAPLSYVDREAAFVLTHPLHMVLGPDTPIDGDLATVCREFLDRTRDYWEEWVRRLALSYDWQEATIRAAITLKLSNFEETGAIIAAHTTSIPEAPGSGRTWDYRYCWLRDAYFVVRALNRIGATRTMEDFISYILTIVLGRSEKLRPVYSVVPSDPMEGRIEPRGQKAAEFALLPDSGIWEFRGRKRIHTHSAAMCWAGCQRLEAIATALGLADRAKAWGEIAAHLQSEILTQTWNPKRQAFTAAVGSDDLDASVLLLAELGLIEPNDPRFVSTLEAVERELRREQHVMRYAGSDDFGLPETAFLICRFWLIDALWMTGRQEEARERFDDALKLRNRYGLLSEDVHPASGALWGNFPQTYSMAGLILTAMKLSRSWEDRYWRGSS